MIIRAVLSGVLLASLAGYAGAQPTTQAAGVARPTPGRSLDRPATRQDGAPRDSSWWIPLTSSVLPGLGQRLLGQDRFIAYLATEIYAIANQANSQRAFERERDEYRRLARDVARAFVPGNSVFGDWDYYEAMEKRLSSGVYDRSPNTGTFSPEVDTSTFNGALWLKARQLSGWTDVNVEPSHASNQYLNALNYYKTRAVTDPLRWSWQNAQLEWDLYRRAIRRANDAHRDRERFLAVIAVNHVLSTIDAFASVRLRGGAGASHGYSITASVPFR